MNQQWEWEPRETIQPTTAFKRGSHGVKQWGGQAVDRPGGVSVSFQENTYTPVLYRSFDKSRENRLFFLGHPWKKPWAM